MQLVIIEQLLTSLISRSRPVALMVRYFCKGGLKLSLYYNYNTSPHPPLYVARVSFAFSLCNCVLSLDFHFHYSLLPSREEFISIL